MPYPTQLWFPQTAPYVPTWQTIPQKRDKYLLDGGIMAPHKILEAYRVMRGGRPNPPNFERHKLYGHRPNVRTLSPIMVRIVVMLLQQHGDQLKIELLWMLIYIKPLAIIKKRLSKTCLGGLVCQPWAWWSKYGELIKCVCAMRQLVLES